MTLEDRVQAQRLRVFRRAEELGNVSAACREAGVSRTLFYRWKRDYEAYGADALHPRRLRAQPGRPCEVPAQLERTVVALALAWPTWGSQRLAVQLARQGVVIAPSTVYRTLKRLGLGTRRQRLGILELHSAERAGLLTERTRKLREVRRKKRHVEARLPGDLVCIDCFYIGKLKGVGRVWQLTACDAACSFGVARVVALRQPTAKALERFLRQGLVPLYRQAGWPIRRVLTDNGSEFKGAFAQACQQLGIRHTRTKPGHAWTNGFVERLQGTILHEHWRVEFRRRYFTRVAQLEVSLQRFLRFYNEQRPHSGYRLRGRTPSELLHGAQR